MKEFAVLKIIDILKPLFEKLGIDTVVLRKILQVKLLMDGRRVPTVFSDSKKTESESEGNQWKMLLVYLIMGISIIPFIIMKSNYIFQMSIVFGIIMFLVMSSLISDFSSVLLDIKDKSILGIRPINLRTLRMAKTIHVTIYMFYITIALVGPALILSIFTQGIAFFVLFLISVILVDSFSIVLTSLVYFFILRFFDGEKLKDIINIVQILLSLTITVGYQLISRLFRIMDINIQFTPKWWQYFIIPVWFSAPFQMLKKSDINLVYIIFTIMAVVIPILSMIFFLHRMPEFEQNLNKLTNHYHRKKKERKDYVSFMASIFCKSKEERIFFRFALDMMKQEREFKLKIYPSIGIALIFPFIFMFQRLTEVSIKEIAKGKSYLFIYFCGLMIPSVILFMQCSAKYKGAWVYKVVPINNIASIFKGTLKAFLGKLFLPIFLLDGILFICIYGLDIIPDLILVFLNMMINMALCFLIMKKPLPFSRPFEAVQNASVASNLILMAIFGVLCGIHYYATVLPYGIYINMFLSVIANIILWQLAFRFLHKKLEE